MRCPHCREVGKCVWTGYGRNWLICENCQRRIGWEELQIGWLLDDEDLWVPGGERTAGGYH